MFLEDVSGLLHELVVVAAAAEDAGFDAAGAVSDFAGGDLGQQCEAVVRQPVGRDAAARQIGPRGEEIVARAGEATLARPLFI